jgi:hypothetical protein
MMIERWMDRAGRALYVSWLTCAAAIAAAAMTGCGPDCAVEATVTVIIDPAVEVQPDRHLIIHTVSKVEETDVTGVDERGVPIGPAADSETGATESLLANTRMYTIEVPTAPYPTWYYAFIDIKEDGKPGTDEPLGVAAGNPTDTGCESTTKTITIMPPAP